MLSNLLPFHIKNLNNQYERIVQVDLNEFSFTDSRAWKDIYMNKAFIPPKVWDSRLPSVEACNVISAFVEDYARIREALRPVFLEHATRELDFIVRLQSYVDLLKARLNGMIYKNGGERSSWMVLDTKEMINLHSCLFQPGVIVVLGWGVGVNGDEIGSFEAA
jgi:hypothetical protein